MGFIEMDQVLAFDLYLFNLATMVVACTCKRYWFNGPSA